jgi:hypothetical protein
MGCVNAGVGVRESLRSWTALAAACVLLASCATGPAALDLGRLDYRPVSRSTLVANGDLNFSVAQRQSGSTLTSVLALQPTGGAMQPVARLIQVGHGPEARLSVQRLPESGIDAGHTDHDIAVLEQLYALVFRQEPQMRYCLGRDMRPCDAGRVGASHAQVLQALADARGKAAAGKASATPWRIVQMRTAPTGSGDPDVVGLRATTGETPLVGADVYFNRAPHSLCVARTRADGVAICRLEDQHGEGDEHEDDATRVVATYPGVVTTDGVLLPTTLVLPAKP